MTNIPAVCPKCRNKNFNSPRPKPEPNDYLTCTKCGHRVQQKDLVRQVTDKVVKEATDKFRKVIDDLNKRR